MFLSPIQRFAALWLLPVLVAQAAEPFRVEVVDKENGWPVSLVELRTTAHTSFFTDNLGLAAIDSPELMDREIYLSLASDGYGVKADGFGNAGIRVTPKSGGKVRVEVERTIIAKRLGRLTGAGLYAEGGKLGVPALLPETGIMGCDSVLITPYRGRLFWLWGDSSVPHYPLGIYDSTAATSSLNPLASLKPPVALAYDYYRDDKGAPRGVAKIPGNGPTWLSAVVALKDRTGAEKLVATYSKIENHLDEWQVGLCVWDDAAEGFASSHVLWKKEDGKQKPLIPRGHPVFWKDPAGKEWLLLGDPFPEFRCPATFEAWSDPSTWEKLPAPANPVAADGSKVPPHRGSVAWSPFRKKWMAIFTQNHGKPSAFGEIWYAEADQPTGPWGTAVKVLSHRNYTFYNPVIHAELSDANGPAMVFEGTYTAEFADRAHPTPRYNYNQILYRLDLDDPKLAPARK